MPAQIEVCKTASLQDISSVQSGGVLVAVHADTDLVEYCSANSAELLGIEPEQLLGQTGSKWMQARWPDLLAITSSEGILEWCQFGGSVPLAVVGHRLGAHRILEFEPARISTRHWWNHSARTRFVEQLTKIHSVENCREFLLGWVSEYSGFDRVMLYHSLPDWNGGVVQEHRNPRVEGLLGLRFPESDIPANARHMFALNWERTIRDVDADSVPILKLNKDTPQLDLTYSTLRSAHPLHIQSLKNMGVRASLTLSLVVAGKLWGLVACHHLSARTLSIEDRLAFEEMVGLVSLHLANLLSLIERDLKAHTRQRLSRLQRAMSTTGDNAKLALSHNLGSMRRTFNASGAWLRFEGEDFYNGMVPDGNSLVPLQDFLQLLPREQVSHYDVLPPELQSYRALTANASGVLFIPLGSSDFLVLLRHEMISIVNWAVKPDLSDDQPGTPPAHPLTPRDSFAVWPQRVKNTSEPWTGTEIEFGETLRLDLQLFLETARLEQVALHDPLTGLANRLLFEIRLEREVRNSLTGNTAFAVFMIDLDKFKMVNDTLGHGAGDQVLMEVATRLMEVVRAEDTVARLGGDEFAILLTGLDERSRATATAERIVQSVSQPYQISGQTVKIGASIGVSVCPSDAVEKGELLECADLALYQVKRSGRNAYSIYAPAMRPGDSHNLDDEMLLRALRNLFFDIQP